MKRPRFEVYKRTDGQWEWRLRAANGRIVATSHSQGFRSARDAKRAAIAVREVALDTGLSGFVRPIEVTS